MAQLASVLAWGASGRPFESDYPDKKKKRSREIPFRNERSVWLAYGALGAMVVWCFSA
jgi:hypothetical protein